MFTYKNVTSKQMHLKVLNDLVMTSPVRDNTILQVPGRDGDLIMDNGRYDSVLRSIPCRIEAPNDSNVEQLINRINNWLVDDGNSHEFKWDNDPGFLYFARIDGSVVSQRMLANLGRTVVDFMLHPIKYIETTMELTPVNSGDNLNK